MKINFLLITIILIIITLACACTDDLPKGDLKITVLDNSENPIPSADVLLYISEQRMENDAKINDGWQITNDKGVVNFVRISAQKYWVCSKITDSDGNVTKTSDSITVFVDKMSELILKF